MGSTPTQPVGPPTLLTSSSSSSRNLLYPSLPASATARSSLESPGMFGGDRPVDRSPKEGVVRPPPVVPLSVVPPLRSGGVTTSSPAGTTERGSTGASSVPPIPRSFLCPLSGGILVDPVNLAPSAEAFERAAITAYLLSAESSLLHPATGLPLTDRVLVSNPSLKAVLDHYCREVRPELWDKREREWDGQGLWDKREREWDGQGLWDKREREWDGQGLWDKREREGDARGI